MADNAKSDQSQSDGTDIEVDVEGGKKRGGVKKGAKREAAATQYREKFGREPKKSLSAVGITREIEKRAVVDRRTAQRSTQVSGIFGGPGANDLPKSRVDAIRRSADIMEKASKDIGDIGRRNGLRKPSPAPTPAPARTPWNAGLTPRAPTILERMGQNLTAIKWGSVAALTVGTGAAVYAGAKKDGKSNSEALKEGAKAAAPGVALMAAPAVSKVAGSVASGLHSIGSTLMEMSFNSPMSELAFNWPAAKLGLGAHALGLGANAVWAVSKVASKAALPLAVGMAAYEGYKGFKKDGAKGAAYGAADSLSGGLLGLASTAYGAVSAKDPAQAMSQANSTLAPSEASQFKRANVAQMGRAAPGQKNTPQGGPKGWANPVVQQAAQQAKAEKYGYKTT